MVAGAPHAVHALPLQVAVLLEERHVVGNLEVEQDDVVEAVVVQRPAKRCANLTKKDSGTSQNS